MGLNSNIFIFLFLPIVVAIYYLFSYFKFNSKIHKIWLIITSLFIYATFGYINILILFSILIFNYLTGTLILKFCKKRSTLLLFLGIFFNISFWFLAKYSIQIFSIYNYIFKSFHKIPEWIIPIGFGIIIIQQLSYLIECYRKRITNNNILDYLNFSTFFPKLIAGPIMSYETFNKLQISNIYSINYQNISAGIYVFFYSFFIKVFFADTFGIIADKGFSLLSLNFVQAWIVALCNTFSIFFDISSYSGMAVGAALLFNIRLPDNFNNLFKANNVKEFWKKWHITFTDFFIKNIIDPILRWRNNVIIISIVTMIAFILMAIWHNLNIQFLLWGLLNAIPIILFFYFKKWNIKIYRSILFILFFIYFNFVWLLFTADNLSQAITVAIGMLSVKSIFLYYNEFYILWAVGANFIIVFMLILSWFIISKTKITEDMILSFKPSFKNLCILIFFIAICLLFNTERAFIYYGF